MKSSGSIRHRRFCRAWFVSGSAILIAIGTSVQAANAPDNEPQKSDQQNVAAGKSTGAAPGADSGQAAATDQRLQKIEDQLRALLDEVEKLRKAKAGEPFAQASPAITLDSKWTQALTWRSIGPAGMG